MAGGKNAIGNLLGKVDANGALVVALDGGTASATKFLAGDGTAAAPSYSFASAATSGWFLTNTTNPTVTVNGTNTARFGASGLIFNAAKALEFEATPLAGADVSLSRGAADRLDLATGDSFKIVSGGLGVGVTETSSGVLSTSGLVRAVSTSATPAGGSATVGIQVGSAFVGFYIGTGVPTLSAAKGSLYSRTDATTTTTRLYINTDGGTTWTNFTTAA